MHTRQCCCNGCFTASDCRCNLSHHLVLTSCWSSDVVLLGDRLFGCQVDAHEDDVNAVTFADETSNILYSGSDDGLCKVSARASVTCTNWVAKTHCAAITSYELCWFSSDTLGRTFSHRQKSAAALFNDTYRQNCQKHSRQAVCPYFHEKRRINYELGAVAVTRHCLQ